ncbi:MAG: hypothetical protein A2054_03010 [Deltaproteobacteria bacterium GWA2_55_10]|nr:MAG: hypothetical protein A2054_03010 [Deltaproteobacteria bacterium GWA2_55_10]
MEDRRKRLKEIHDEVPPDYYDRSMATNPFQWFWHTRRISVLSNLVQGQDGRMLDIGAGGGTLLDRISRKAGLSFSAGVDSSYEAVRYGHAFHKGPRFICADFHELPFADSSFDCATAIEVLEHLDNPERAMNELRRCLKDNGKVLILVPNEKSILFRIIWYFWTKGKGRVWKDAHVQQFTRESLGALLRSTGFEPVQWKMFLLGMLMSVKGVKRRA